MQNKTCDLYIAAYLKASGLDMQTETTGTQKVNFIFDCDIRDKIIEFSEGKASINPLRYAQEIKALKSLVKSL